jgi:hypothetical protein
VIDGRTLMHTVLPEVVDQECVATAATRIIVADDSSIGGFYHLVCHYADREWRVVYVRPR